MRWEFNDNARGEFIEITLEYMLGRYTHNRTPQNNSKFSSDISALSEVVSSQIPPNQISIIFQPFDYSLFLSSFIRLAHLNPIKVVLHSHTMIDQLAEIDLVYFSNRYQKYNC